MQFPVWRSGQIAKREDTSKFHSFYFACLNFKIRPSKFTFMCLKEWSFISDLFYSGAMADLRLLTKMAPLIWMSHAIACHQTAIRCLKRDVLLMARVICGLSAIQETQSFKWRCSIFTSSTLELLQLPATCPSKFESKQRPDLHSLHLCRIFYCEHKTSLLCPAEGWKKRRKESRKEEAENVWWAIKTCSMYVHVFVLYLFSFFFDAQRQCHWRSLI